MSKLRIGNGYDVHLLAPGRRMVLGGVEIEHSKGCVAHSDGDAVIHAFCDALLGTLGLGDIGHFFPDTSDEFAGIDSRILLERTYSYVLQKGYRLVNADNTLLLQKPKIAPYIAAMRESMGAVIDNCEADFDFGDRETLESGKERIAVKATTTEGAGFVGREEGVASYSVVLVEKFR